MSQEQFLTFIDRFRDDLRRDPESWANPSLSEFLETMAAQFAKILRPLPGQIHVREPEKSKCWLFMSDILFACKVVGPIAVAMDHQTLQLYASDQDTNVAEKYASGQIASDADFAEFLAYLYEDFDLKPESWKCQSLDEFFVAIANNVRAVTEPPDIVCENDEGCLDKLTGILSAARIYE